MIAEQDDALNALWQRSTPVDVAAIADRIRHLNRMHRAMNQATFAFSMIIAVLIGLNELLGRLATGGMAFGVCAIVILATWFHHRRARKRLSAQWSTDPRAMLMFAVGRARAGRRLARALNAGVPVGTILGYAAGAGIGHLNGAVAERPPLWALLATALLISITTVAGVRMGRQRARDIDHLEARLRAMDDAV